MSLFVLRRTALAAAGLLVSSTAMAQLGPVPLTYPPAAASAPEVAAPAPPPPADAPPALPSPTAAASTAAPAAAPAPGTPDASAVAPRPLGDLSGAIGFGVGLVPSTQLAGTSGAVAIKVWLSDRTALSPLLNLRFVNPKQMDISWTVRPEIVVLYAPFANATTRFQIGGGFGFGITKPPPVVMVPPVGIDQEHTTTTYNLSVPIQAGVEHFFTRWLSIGFAVRTSIIELTKDANYSEFAFSLDSTKLLAQLFIYSD